MPSRMSAGDEIAVVEGYRTILRDCLASMDPAAVLRLRGELQVLSRWLAVQKKSALQRTADEALDAVSRFYLYGQEIDGLRASNRSAETASYYDLASVGVLAVEDVLTADHPTLMRFLMSGLSEGLMLLGRRQYVSGSDAVLLASWRTHSTAARLIPFGKLLYNALSYYNRGTGCRSTSTSSKKETRRCETCSAARGPASPR